jgi:asparagine synthetase B (glutamine-hydrolysing)
MPRGRGVLWDSEKHYEECRGPWSSEEESVLRGLVMGTKDYVAKCGFKRVLIGLSGGIDSSLVAVIARKGHITTPFRRTQTRPDRPGQPSSV